LASALPRDLENHPAADYAEMQCATAKHGQLLFVQGSKVTVPCCLRHTENRQPARRLAWQKKPAVIDVAAMAGLEIASP
jgi:hypothetical protein